jgi:hypothetical protein
MKSLHLIPTALLGILLLVFATPAFAVKQSAAVAMCERNPKCRLDPGSGGAVYLHVGNNVIFCPQQGDCSCIDCGHPIPDRQSGMPGRSVTGNIGTLLRQ